MKFLVPLTIVSCVVSCRGERSRRPDDARINARTCPNVTLDEETHRFLGNTPNEISSMLFVGGDIVRRDGPELSAIAMVTDLGMKQTVERIVSAGDVVNIGADRYCVTELSADVQWTYISLRKVVSPL